jgi:hypothetical protein
VIVIAQKAGEGGCDRKNGAEFCESGQSRSWRTM